MRVKFKDLRQGVTVYLVHAFPESESGWIKKHVLKGKPHKNNNINTWQVDYLPPENSRYYPNDPCKLHHFMLADANVRFSDVARKPYNFHAVFHTRKEAERYMERIARGCLTHAEQLRVEARQERQIMCDDMDWTVGIDHDLMF